MTCLRCKHAEVKRFGFYGPYKIQRYRCPACKATFSEPRQKPLGRHYIQTEKAAQIIELLLEGMSVRSVSRITGTHQGTILSLLLTVGNKCRNLFDARVRNIRPRFVQADELWTFAFTPKRGISFQATRRSGATPTFGWRLIAKPNSFCPTSRRSATPRALMNLSAI